MNQSDAPAGFDGCDETGGTVVLLCNLRRAFQRREQVGKPSMIFRIVGQRIGDEPFTGDLLQSDLARSRQRMRRMYGDTDRETVKLLEHEPRQNFR